jgi:beta-lactam-binding protein with PASTA domain
MPLRVVSSSSSGVSGGAVQVVVPNVAGKSEAEAKAALDDFTVRVRTVEASGTAGTVFAQDPAAATIRPRRSQVTIFVIVNPAPDNEDVATALNELTEAVTTLGTTALETEQSAKDRNDVVLQRLQEIKDGLPPSGGGGPELASGKSSTPSKTPPKST